MADAVIDYPSGCLAYIVIDFIVTVTGYSFLPDSGSFAEVLLIFYRLQTCVFFVEPLIDRLQLSSVNDERSALIGYCSDEMMWVS